ncbi:hypothetical protein FRUB_07861 [Fimbriiglobus ruber]|uniref:Uncharacterized protein n=1 Tax=Fimbriiglobus ruber TaxID=1908690 RepID=A0A225DB05_9BACT|nr:hypothetical protein FRUB_07861 [Fimbriiglobus ruber]
MTCPHCRESARCKGFKSRQLVSLFGPLEYSRHYYLCRHCHHGISPLDGVLGLRAHDLTPAADEVVCLSGLEDSFATAADTVLPRLAGLRVSESTVSGRPRRRRAVGRSQHAARRSARRPVAWHKDADGENGRLRVGRRHRRRATRFRGAKAEGRMAYIGMIDNPVPRKRPRWANPTAAKRPEWKARYVSQVRSLAELAEPLRRQASQVNLGGADRWVALSDGGIGLEDFLRANFPVWKPSSWTSTTWPNTSPNCPASCIRGRGRGPAMAGDDVRGTQDLRRIRRAREGPVVGSRRPGRGGECSCGGRDVLHESDPSDGLPALLGPGLADRQWSGGECLQDGHRERMKGGGMRWGEDGADAMSHLRALFCSSDNQWAAFWSKN